MALLACSVSGLSERDFPTRPCPGPTIQRWERVASIHLVESRSPLPFLPHAVSDNLADGCEKSRKRKERGVEATMPRPPFYFPLFPPPFFGRAASFKKKNLSDRTERTSIFLPKRKEV